MSKATCYEEMSVRVFQEGRPVYEVKGTKQKCKRVFDRFFAEKYQQDE